MTRKILILCCAVLLSCQQKSEQKLNIAVAANMQFVMQELKKAFFEETKIPCQLIISSSGKLTAQIKNGAPFDVFLSADLKYPTYLHQKGFTSYKPQIYAYGKLALWTKNKNIVPKLQNLDKNKIKHIAIANAKTAPYGKATIEVLKKTNQFNLLNPKLVYAESIGQVNQFIYSQSVEIGFTSLSSIIASPNITKNMWCKIDENLHNPIAQGMIVLHNKNLKQGNLFLKFMMSQKAKNILKEFGYGVK